MNDSISRTKVISLITMRAEYVANDDIHDELAILMNKIKNMPAVEEVSAKQGKWIYKSNDYAYGIPEYECDQCGYWVHEKSKYCPECGARMVQDD